MSSGPVLGIDLGTTNSVVAVADGTQVRIISDPEGRRMVPSVVSFQSAGGILVGYDARARRLVDAKNTVYAVKRLIGRPFDSTEVERARDKFAFEIQQNKYGGTVIEVRKGQYALAEISAMVLRELRRIAEISLEVACERAVITVPANFNELQRSATKAAGRVAGLEVLRMLNEPTAAALAYGYGSTISERIAVYDLGGGTFDFTILELENDVFEVLATAGDTFLGGEDIDDALAQRMCEVFLTEHQWDPRSDHQAYERLKAAAEWAKCQLSSEMAVELSVEELTYGEGGRSLDLTFEMTRDELNALAQPWLARAFEVCDRALETANLAASDIDSIVLVGGSTRMPLCHQMVEAYFGKTPRIDIDPDMVVAQGAAIHGYALGGKPEQDKVSNKSALGRVKLKRMTQAEVSERKKLRNKVETMEGVPRQPAFAPPELPLARRPKRREKIKHTKGAPPVPDLPPPSVPPGPPVVAARVVEVSTPKTTMDIALDDLQPTNDMQARNSIDDLAPPRFAEVNDPFADLAPADPFAEPVAGGSRAAPFFDALPPPAPPGQRKVPAREPTVPFVVERHKPVAPPTDVGGRPPPPPPRPAMPPPIPPATPDAPTYDLPDLPLPSERPRDIQSVGAAPRFEMPSVPTGLVSKPPQVAIAVVPMAEAPPPILMDVTPHSLSVETVGGFCRRLIGKNAPVPTEQLRSFTTGQDNQREVAVRICQGESETFLENEVLGEIVLSNLPQRTRGEVSIDVGFILDANGTLQVNAIDTETKQAHAISINLRGGLSDADIAGMRLRIESEELGA